MENNNEEIKEEIIIVKEEVKKPEHKKESKDHKDHKEKKGFFASISEGFKNVIAEYHKVIWPSRELLVKQTMTVIVISLMVGAIISVMDIALKYGYTAFVGLFA